MNFGNFLFLCPSFNILYKQVIILAEQKNTLQSWKNEMKFIPRLTSVSFVDGGSETNASSREVTPAPADAVNAENVNELGKPRLGEITKCVVKIKESKEFKVGFKNDVS